MSEYEKLAQRYIDVWNETDPTARRAAIDALFTEDVTFVDPMAAVRGQDEVDWMIGGVQSQFPGFVITLLGTVDGHHAQARFGWEMGLPGQEAPVAGFDVVTLAEDGRIDRVLGFLDRVPAQP
ncbi:nuclear transport factor 2 family protein [Dactylosporangium aurantiacum]|uniref:Nuclear transport factor 2 family protein n=1 Tax=Dactylosporangium aurantiacum TaxID=35754 RepID=A0A9Q9IMJ0_9ACTN|nr:nuclear transport factor 2 family protein [Dactylosporangium aurantiacum]MDG6104725.1 nuclear transport factor 2 family protein [Dactylosporangium aurantiacum]UWZ55708.1 nuclear transport factor 2 family protein [Dactylosporangium aurantiacum]